MAIVRLKPCYLDKYRAEQAFNQKHNAEKVNELLKMCNLASVDYSKGYQAKPRPQLTGGSAAMNAIEAYRLKAVNELLSKTIVK